MDVPDIIDELVNSTSDESSLVRRNSVEVLVKLAKNGKRCCFSTISAS